MKKNVMMRLAAILLVCVLASTCGISGTYAKYVTSASSSETARVAKFGVEVSSQVDGLFATTYATDSAYVGNTVISATEVVAPGTKNDTGVTFSVTGTPEVAVNVQFNLTVNKDVIVPAADDTYLDWTTGNNTSDTFNLADAYTPVVFTLNYGSTTVSGTLDDIRAHLVTISKDYAPGTNLGADFGTFTLTWAWVFNGNDKADTLLGNIAAGVDTTVYTGVSHEIDFEIELIVTQID